MRILIPDKQNTEYVPITVPIIGHKSRHCSATQKPLTKLITIKTAATRFDETKIAVVVLSADSKALSAETIEPSNKKVEKMIEVKNQHQDF